MTYAHATRKQREPKRIATSAQTQGNAQNSNQENVTVQDPASKKWSTTAIVLEERELGNLYVLTTEGTEKTFIRG